MFLSNVSHPVRRTRPLLPVLILATCWPQLHVKSVQWLHVIQRGRPDANLRQIGRLRGIFCTTAVPDSADGELHLWAFSLNQSCASCGRKCNPKELPGECQLAPPSRLSHSRSCVHVASRGRVATRVAGLGSQRQQ